MPNLQADLCQAVSQKIKDIAVSIAAESQKQHPGETNELLWDKFTIGKLTLQKPIPADDIAKNYPPLFSLLSEPFTDNDTLVDIFSQPSELFCLGYWRNPGTDFSSLQFFFRTSDPSHKNLPVLTFFVSANFGRSLQSDKSEEIIDNFKMDSPDVRKLSEALDSCLEFVDKIIESGTGKATIASKG